MMSFPLARSHFCADPTETQVMLLITIAGGVKTILKVIQAFKCQNASVLLGRSCNSSSMHGLARH